MAWEKLPVQLACRVLGVAESGFDDWRSRSPSPRSLRHAWLTEQIQAVHQASFGTYGTRRVHAELRLGTAIVLKAREEVTLEILVDQVRRDAKSVKQAVFIYWLEARIKTARVRYSSSYQPSDRDTVLVDWNIYVSLQQ